MYLPLGQGSVLYVIEVLVQRIAGPKMGGKYECTVVLNSIQSFNRYCIICSKPSG
jgi:hypothetical protein